MYSVKIFDRYGKKLKLVSNLRVTLSGMNSRYYYILYVLASVGLGVTSAIFFDLLGEKPNILLNITLSFVVLCVFIISHIRWLRQKVRQTKQPALKTQEDVLEHIQGTITKDIETHTKNTDNAQQHDKETPQKHAVLHDKDKDVHPLSSIDPSIADINNETTERIEELKKFNADFLTNKNKREVQDPNEKERLQKFIQQIQAKTTPPTSKQADKITERNDANIANNLKRDVMQSIQKWDTTKEPSAPPKDLAEHTHHHKQEYFEKSEMNHNHFQQNILHYGQPEIFLQSIVDVKEQNTQFYNCLAALMDAEQRIIPHTEWYHSIKQQNLLASLDMMLLSRLAETMQKFSHDRVMMASHYFMTLSKDAMNEPSYGNEMKQFLHDFKLDRPNHPLLHRLVFIMNDDVPHETKLAMQQCRGLGINLCVDGARLTSINAEWYYEKGYQFIRVKESMLRKEIEEERMNDVIIAKKYIEKTGLNIIVTNIDNAQSAQNMRQLDIKYASGSFYEKAFSLHMQQ